MTALDAGERGICLSGTLPMVEGVRVFPSEGASRPRICTCGTLTPTESAPAGSPRLPVPGR